MFTLSLVITVLILLGHLQTIPWKMILISVYLSCLPGQTFLSVEAVLYFTCEALYDPLQQFKGVGTSPVRQTSRLIKPSLRGTFSINLFVV
jgi:uncharacterized protein YggT (Ycf19 family)